MHSSATRLIILSAILLLACAAGEENDGATAQEAYSALLDFITGPKGYAAIPRARLSVTADRSIRTQPGAPSWVIAQATDHGVPVAQPGAPLCPGDYKLSFGPAKSESRNVYLIEMDVLSMSAYGFGDAETFEYRIDCRTGSCAVAFSRQLEQGEIGGGAQCDQISERPRNTDPP